MSDNDVNRPADDAIGRLIHSAGRRTTAPEAARTRVYAAAKAAWQRSISDQHGARRIRKRSRRFFWLAAAASAAVVAFLFQSIPHPGRNRVEVGSLSRTEGPVFLGRAGAEPELLGSELDDTLHVGDVLLTGGGGRAAVRLPDGVSLRISESTEVALESLSTMSLRRGTIYLDAGRLSGTDSDVLVVSTPFGSVRHSGTQYEVNVGADALRIRVREGAIVFSDASRELATESGQQILIPADGPPVRSEIASYDAAWEWVADLATVQGPGPHRLAALLAWIAREMGRELRYASPGVEAQAALLTLHGAEGLTPREALDVIRSTTDFEYRLQDGVLLVSSP